MKSTPHGQRSLTAPSVRLKMVAEVMAMSTPETTNDPRRPKPAPVEYGGQWVAWDRSLTRILAHGSNVAEVRQAAIAAGHSDAVLEKVRRPGVSFIGAA